MSDYTTRWSSRFEEGHGEHEDRENAARFLVNALTMTVYSSGEDYDRALSEFFSQLEALGLLLGATDIDEVSVFLRRACRPL